MNTSTDTIVAPATASGGAIAVIRLSGPEAIACCDRIFRGRKPLAEAAGHTLHYGEVIDGDRTIDDVVAAIYRAPHSYTGEDAVELSCHGSPYIVSEIIALLLRSGARMAQPGEFTIRAFLAGRGPAARARTAPARAAISAIPAAADGPLVRVGAALPGTLPPACGSPRPRPRAIT